MYIRLYDVLFAVALGFHNLCFGKSLQACFLCFCLSFYHSALGFTACDLRFGGLLFEYSFSAGCFDLCFASFLGGAVLCSSLCFDSLDSCLRLQYLALQHDGVQLAYALEIRVVFGQNNICYIKLRNSQTVFLKSGFYLAAK